jgi:hypothetical protein
MSLEHFKDYSVTEPVEKIFVIENFMETNEIETLLNFIKNSTQKDWEEEYLSNLVTFCKMKFNRTDVDNLVKEGLFEVTENWSDKVIRLDKEKEISILNVRLQKKLDTILDSLKENLEGNFGILQRMQPGVELRAHFDNYTDESIRYAAILYVNDDYNGGNLFFTNKNFEIKPKPGTIIFFPGTEEYHHGVKIVLDGPTRYCIPGFVKVKNFYKEKNIDSSYNIP